MDIDFNDRLALVLTEVQDFLNVRGEMTSEQVDSVVRRWSTTDFDSASDDSIDIGLEDYNTLLARVNTWVVHQVMHGQLRDATGDGDEGESE